jgi:hypothetical protein
LQSFLHPSRSSILILSIVLDKAQPDIDRLHLVESAGTWVESQMTYESLSVAKLLMSPRTAVIFVPWNHVARTVGSLDVPAIADSITR